MRRTMIAAMLTAATLAGTAQAQMFPTTKPQLDQVVGQFFTSADRNGDGQLDRAETAAALGVTRDALSRGQAPFSLETGPDGRPQLSVDQGGMLNMLYQGVDRNGDERLSLGEVRAAARDRFDAADTNHDGKLDKAELATAKQQFGAIQQAIAGAR